MSRCSSCRSASWTQHRGPVQDLCRAHDPGGVPDRAMSLRGRRRNNCSLPRAISVAEGTLLWCKALSPGTLRSDPHGRSRSPRNTGGRKSLCTPSAAKEVVDKSDLAGSTEFIIETIRKSEIGSYWAVGTEVHLVNRSARNASAAFTCGFWSDCQCLRHDDVGSTRPTCSGRWIIWAGPIQQGRQAEGREQDRCTPRSGVMRQGARSNARPHESHAKV